MTDIEAKALALVNEICLENGVIPYAKLPNIEASEALCRAIEQHENFRQEVSDAVGDTLFMVETHCDGEAVALVSNRLLQFIIPKPKPDPLVAAVHEVDTGPAWDSPEDYGNKILAALDALGFEIREKNDD